MCNDIHDQDIVNIPINSHYNFAKLIHDEENLVEY